MSNEVSDFTGGPMQLDCVHSLLQDGACKYCGRNVLAEAAEATGMAQDSAAKELDALTVIVGGFEALPAEARDRVYSYLMSRFPAAKRLR